MGIQNLVTLFLPTCLKWAAIPHSFCLFLAWSRYVRRIMYTGAVLPGPGVAGAGGRHLLPAAPAGRGPLPLHRGGPQPDLLHSLLSHSAVETCVFLIKFIFHVPLGAYCQLSVRGKPVLCFRKRKLDCNFFKNNKLIWQILPYAQSWARDIFFRRFSVRLSGCLI